MAQGNLFQMYDNYIYLYHVDQFLIIPSFPETFTDTINVNFASQTPMGRSAPIYSYSNSGPRNLQINLDLHRDLMTSINYGISNAKVAMGDDYVDTLIKQIQAIALPSYNGSQKLINPPMIAVRFANEIFIKGIVNGNVSTTYNLPLLENNKYAHVMVSFNVFEVDPYDAKTVMQTGSFRGLDMTLERNIWKGVG